MLSKLHKWDRAATCFFTFGHEGALANCHGTSSIARILLRCSSKLVGFVPAGSMRSVEFQTSVCPARVFLQDQSLCQLQR